MAKITAGDGYTYLTRHTANGDAEPTGQRDATAYYTAQGCPPGRWTGRGAPLLGLAGQVVTEDQMRALFGMGMHPDYEAMIDSYLIAHPRRGATTPQSRDRLIEDAIKHATLGRPFHGYERLAPFDDRVAQRLAAIRHEARREPIPAEVKKIKAEEARRQRAAVAGFDLVFSPVKSAALLWAADEREWVRDAIRAAHEEAKDSALKLVEQHAALTRAGTNGVAQIATNGLIAAEFEHWDSRAGDPCLHTHVAVSAKVQGIDGKWRALDARSLYAMITAASEHYNTAFEAALTARVGVTFTPRPGTASGKEPVREITGVPLEMIMFFSRRRAAIEARYAELARAYRDEHGRDPGQGARQQLARQANLETRQGKKPPATLAAKRAAWRDQLTTAFGPAALTQLTSAIPHAPPAPQPAPAPDIHALAQRAVATVATRRSTWTTWNIRAEAERLLRAEVPVMTPTQHQELAESVTALALSPAYSISVEAPALLDEPPELRRADGGSVFTQHAAARFTSQAVLDAEQRLLTATQTATACSLGGASAAAALDGFEANARTILDAGQRHLVTAFACDSRLLLAGIGPAGSGKTTAMRALAHVLRQGGQSLVPLATSAAAADVLGRELGVRTENVHKFLHEWTAGPHAAQLRAGATVPEQAAVFRLGPGDVVLVDEAGMAGTFPLDTLVALASARGAVVRLLGDDRQLPAVEGGGALRLVASQPGTPLLSVLYRFRDPAEAAATLQLRAGDAAAIDWYARNDRIRAGSRETMAQAAYDGWKNDMLTGKITLMAAADNTTITELSARARADRVAAGQVEADGVRLRDGNLAGAGDWIVTRQNQRRLSLFAGRDWVKNGDAWRVEQRHADGSLTVRGMAHRGRTRLPATYVGEHVQLLYATTAHRAQGSTVDTAHPLITAGMTREALYVLATRARERTTLYVATHDQPFDDDPRVNRVRSDPKQYAAREVLLNIIAAESATLPATETIAVVQQEAGSLATLIPRYLHASRQHAEPRYQQAAIQALGENHGQSVIADPAWDTLTRRLFDAETSGLEPARLLSIAAANREVLSASSVAEVLTWRIDTILKTTPRKEADTIQYSPTPLPPWLPPPPPPKAERITPSDSYLAEAATLISARVRDLTETAIRDRPPWLAELGQPPPTLYQRQQWLRHVAIIAAYRDQYKITATDPTQILGPFVESSYPDHPTYQHAAYSVEAAFALGSSESKYKNRTNAARPIKSNRRRLVIIPDLANSHAPVRFHSSGPGQRLPPLPPSPRSADINQSP